MRTRRTLWNAGTIWLRTMRCGPPMVGVGIKVCCGFSALPPHWAWPPSRPSRAPSSGTAGMTGSSGSWWCRRPWRWWRPSCGRRSASCVAPGGRLTFRPTRTIPARPNPGSIRRPPRFWRSSPSTCGASCSSSSIRSRLTRGGT